MGLATYVSHGSHNTIEYSFVTFKNGVLTLLYLPCVVSNGYVDVSLTPLCVSPSASSRHIWSQPRISIVGIGDTIPFHLIFTTDIIVSQSHTGIRSIGRTTFVSYTANKVYFGCIALSNTNLGNSSLILLYGRSTFSRRFPETVVSISFPLVWGTYGGTRWCDDHAETLHDSERCE
jgi:hypothetical protein